MGSRSRFRSNLKRTAESYRENGKPGADGAEKAEPGYTERRNKNGEKKRKQAVGKQIKQSGDVGW